MPHDTALIATIAAGLGLAFLLGLVATRLRLPPLVGYLVAGVIIGPYTPGFVADAGLAQQLSEIGVILLMFGVGIHFSVGDLMAVRRIALPGATVQIGIATALGAVMAHWWGWSWGAGLVFGLSLSVASTVVLLRALEDRGMLDSVDGRIAVGWLVVEDLATVVVLVLLPALAIPLGAPASTDVAHVAEASLGRTIGVTLSKVVAFVVLMFVVGRRVVPWLLQRVAQTGSRELFTLCVLGIAVGIAVGSAALFGVSFALGAFFAGMVINGSPLSHEAATNSLPLQDAFAVLFFVSVGMLFDPAILIREPLEVLAVVFVILIGKSLGAFLIVLAFRYPVHTALTISASLAQVGEFSFILAALGVSLGILPLEGQGLVVAGAILSISLNPMIFASGARIAEWINKRPRLLALLERESLVAAEPLPAAIIARLRGHAVLVGHGRVGGTIAQQLREANVPHVVIEQNLDHVEQLREEGELAVFGDASRPEVLEQADIADARLLVVTAPDPYQARAIVAAGRKRNPSIDVVVRTHSAQEKAYLEKDFVVKAVLGERELALAMAREALMSCRAPAHAPTGT